MDSIKNIAIGGIITLLVGGTAYTISQTDVVQNFADDTGLTQEQAEQYVNSISEDELASWGKIGSDFMEEGQALLDVAYQIDCVNYEYEWESATLSCVEGKAQLEKVGTDSQSLGQAYIKLGSDSAGEEDIHETIRLIDQINLDYQFEIVSFVLDQSTIDESRKTNSYNKALLQAVLEAE